MSKSFQLNSYWTQLLAEIFTTSLFAFKTLSSKIQAIMSCHNSLMGGNASKALLQEVDSKLSLGIKEDKQDDISRLSKYFDEMSVAIFTLITQGKSSNN